MKRSKLRDDFFKDRNGASQCAYKKQRYLCVTLLQKARKQHFLDLDPKIVTNFGILENQLNHSRLIK